MPRGPCRVGVIALAWPASLAAAVGVGWAIGSGRGQPVPDLADRPPERRAAIASAIAAATGGAEGRQAVVPPGLEPLPETPSLGSEPTTVAGHPEAGAPADERGSIREMLAARIGGEIPDALVDRVLALRRERIAAAPAEALGQVAEEERRRREVARLESSGEMPRLLAKLRESATPMDDLVRSRDRFITLMATGAVGPRADAGALREISPLTAGTQIELTAGTHSLPRHLVGSPPVGLVISGAGIDRTWLAGEMTLTESLLGLTLQDLTLTDQDVIDLRGDGVLTLTLRRVRAAGYNSGAGGSSFLDLRGVAVAIHAEDCVFDGRFRDAREERGPDRHGTPFDLSTSALLLRFDRCAFIGNSEPVEMRRGGTVHFRDCTFRGNRQAVVGGATYEHCTFEGNEDVRDGYDPDARWSDEEQAARWHERRERARDGK